MDFQREGRADIVSHQLPALCHAQPRIINEIYYPHADQPNTRDFFQFLITDGETFCHEEKRDLDSPDRVPGARLPLL